MQLAVSNDESDDELPCDGVYNNFTMIDASMPCSPKLALSVCSKHHLTLQRVLNHVHVALGNVDLDDEELAIAAILLKIDCFSIEEESIAHRDTA